jgi:putative acetyltransferase
MKTTYLIADTDQEFGQAKELFEEYAQTLHIDLSFQNFSRELENIRDQYAKPSGALILVYVDDAPAGCAGIRKQKDGIAELKRMYVKPDFRGYKLGKELLERSLEAAKELGYLKVRLDTLASMLPARKLYESFGFHEIPAYYLNPMDDAIYMEKDFESQANS